MKGKIITLMCATALLSSCHIYKAYDRPEDITAEGLYRDTANTDGVLPSDTANFGNVPWREVFTDPQLQDYIETALANNADLRSAALNVEQAQAALTSARLAYLPQLALSPQGTISSFDKGKATQTYQLPITASWQIDLFGQILNPKRNAQVSLKQTQYYEQAVQTQLIANVANMYYISVGILANGVESFASLAADAGLKVEALTWGNMFIKNLLPVTLGNIVGGAGLVGLPYWFVYVRNSKKA